MPCIRKTLGPTIKAARYGNRQLPPHRKGDFLVESARRQGYFTTGDGAVNDVKIYANHFQSTRRNPVATVVHLS